MLWEDATDWSVEIELDPPRSGEVLVAWPLRVCATPTSTW